MGMEPLGINQGESSPDDRPAESRGDLQMGKKTRPAPFCETDPKGPFIPRGIFPAGKRGWERPDRGVGGSGDDPDGPMIADTAIAARAGPAIWCRLARFGLVRLGQKKFSADAAVDSLPRKDRRTGAFLQGGLNLDSGPANRLLPEVEPKTVAPAVETTAQPIGLFDQIAGLPTAPREDSLEQTHPGIMPFHADIPVPETAPEKILPGDNLVDADLALPLERGVGLRNEGRKADRHLTAAFRGPKDAVGEIDDSFEILLALAGKAEHEVEFHRSPAGREDPLRRGDQFSLRAALVDRVPEALCPRLGCERETRFPDPPDPVDQPLGEGFRAERRQRKGDTPVIIPVHQRGEKGFDVGVVAGTQRKERNFIMPG